MNGNEALLILKFIEYLSNISLDFGNILNGICCHVRFQFFVYCNDSGPHLSSDLYRLCSAGPYSGQLVQKRS